MEVFLYVLVQGWVNVVDFEVVVFINFICDYFDYYGIMEVYGEVKVCLFVWLGLQVVVINIDDVFGVVLVECLFFMLQCLWVSVVGLVDVEVFVIGIVILGEGFVFQLYMLWGMWVICSLLLGCFNVVNLFIVVVCLGVLGELFE